MRVADPSYLGAPAVGSKQGRKQGWVFHELLMLMRLCRDGKGVTIQRDGFPGSVVMLFLVGPWMVISFALPWPLIGKMCMEANCERGWHAKDTDGAGRSRDPRPPRAAVFAVRRSKRMAVA